MQILVDYNLTGQGLLLRGTLVASSWTDLLPMEILTFRDIELPINSDDRTVWRFAQVHSMLLFTANRNKKGKNSLEQTIIEEASSTSLPVITVGNADRLLERIYREQCIERLVEIVVDIEQYLGTNRLFIP